MLRVIALTQFVFLALGTMAMTILMKAHASGTSPSALRTFLSLQGVWLMLIPIVWLVYAEISRSVDSGFLSTKFARVSGVVITTVIFAVYAWAILGA